MLDCVQTPPELGVRKVKQLCGEVLENLFKQRSNVRTQSLVVRGGQQSPAQHDPRGVAGSLATPRSVVDGSAARRARGGCIDGGSDG